MQMLNENTGVGQFSVKVIFTSVCSFSGVKSYLRKGCDNELKQPSFHISSVIFDMSKVINNMQQQRTKMKTVLIAAIFKIEI